MRPLDELNRYLESIRRRLMAEALLRGAAIAAVSALVVTVALVLVTNSFAFSENSLRWSRVFLFLAVAFAVSFGVVAPILAINRRRAARKAERAFPEFNQRLVTCLESADKQNPLLHLLARDTIKIAEHSSPSGIARSSWLAGFSSAAAVAGVALMWLIFAGPGYFGYGAALLWGGTPKIGNQPFYDILVTPGDQLVRRRADQLVTAQLVGFTPQMVKLKARYKGTTKWEEVAMLPTPGAASYEFLFASLPDEVDYFVEAGGIRSKEYKLSVLDLPSIKKLKVTYKFPGWSGMKPAVEDPGGDLRAVEGTEALIEIETDKPLNSGVIVVNDMQMPLEKLEGNRAQVQVPVREDGTYHIATIEKQQRVRLSEDYFIEARKETPPVVKLSRPGRDLKVSPIEEVTLAASAEDDFALTSLELKYTVNGGEEKTLNLLDRKGTKSANGQKMIELEAYKLAPGDVVSVYAVAKDARNTTQTDIYFLEAQPFEREYSQSQQAGGEGQGGGQPEEQISQRQKEIIAATWNQTRGGARAKSQAAEDAKFLTEVQTKLSSQAKTLAERIRARQLSGASETFTAFAKDMDAAAAAMLPAAEALRAMKWKEALPHEQKALQALLRAEARFREIQVAFGRQGGGGGGGGQQRDLESLFDLELDTEKNQYETGTQAASRDKRQQQVDEAVEKLTRLARRQQELAQQQQAQRKTTPEQRWQQEALRREMEQLQKELEQMQQQGQQGQQSQSGQQSGQQSGSQSGQSGQSGQSPQQQQSPTQQRLQQMARDQQKNGSQGQAGADPRIQRTIDNLRRANEDMRRAAANDPQSGKGGEAEASRAAERLQEAKEALGGLRRDETSGQLDDLARRAERIANDQKEFANQLRKNFGQGQPGQQQGALGQMPSTDPNLNNRLADEKVRLMEDFKKLEQDIQSASRALSGSQRQASNKLRQALGELQQEEIGLKMKYMSEWLRRGYGPMAWQREQPVTMALDKLSDQVKQAAQSGERGDGKGQGMERTLSQLENLRRQLAQAARNAQRGQQGEGKGQGQQGEGQQGQGRQAGQGQQGKMGGNGKGGQMTGMSGGERGFGERGAINTGDRPGQSGNQQAPQPGATGGDAERAWREGMRELQSLRGQLAESPETARELESLLREMQQLDPKRFPGNPALVERLRTQVLPNLEQLELHLRRQMEEKGGQARTGTADRVPAGYGDAVAEYFRKLGKAKP